MARQSPSVPNQPTRVIDLTLSRVEQVRRPRWWKSRLVRGLVRHRLALWGLVALVVLALAALMAPVVAGQDPYTSNLRLIRQPPQVGHLLGTDGAGRDVWARLVYGARVSLSVGLVAVSIWATIGLVLGSIAGFYGGTVDSLLMRFTDIILCFPTFLVILSIVTIVGPSIFNVMAVIGLFGWPEMARLVRGQFLSLREQDFILAARAVGVPNRRIIARHLVPNIVAPISVAVTLGLASAILTEAGLSFLGVGVQMPTPSWGNMLFGAQSVSIIENNWWLWLPPGLLIAVTVLAINFVGDGLRAALDPRMRLD
jgi:peptide/nickel transport system permease protein